MTRHCMSCDADVEDAGGYCLLGHPLRLNMETSSMADLKAEVEAAFETAQDEVRESLSPLIQQVEAYVPEQEHVMASAVATMAAPVAPPAAPAPQAPAAHAPMTQVSKRTAPPPPPPQRPKTGLEDLWGNMEGGKPLDRQDPINAFAPPPRMDWGPERASRKGRGLRRLRQANA